MEIYYQPDLADGKLYLTEEESKHCLKVLRHNIGDQIKVVNGQGMEVRAEITEPNSKKCGFRILEEKQEAKASFSIHIAIAPTKNMVRLEWFVEKAVELGIQNIDFYFAHHSERRHIKPERLVKKAVSAMKQSGQSFLPLIAIHKDLKSLIAAKSNIDEHFIAYVDFNNPELLFDIARKNVNSIVLIGPEGDFSEDELQRALDSGYRKVSLGSRRLRTETAALAACHILNLVNR